jgi:hypothetical protein
MNPARRGIEGTPMTATRISRRASARRASRARKAVPRRVPKAGPKPTGKLVSKFAPAPQVQFRLCKPGWAVLVDKIPNAQGTRFVCPFCPLSHRVPGPVRGFRKMRRAQWVKLRRVEE